MVTAYDTKPTDFAAALASRLAGRARVLTFAEWENERDKESLGQADMLATVDIAIRTLEELYVHLDLKRARRGVDPVQQLRVFRERVAATGGIAPRAFHEAMLQIFKSLGDAHTAYRLPPPHKFAVAFLPFLMNAHERGASARSYIVSHVLAEGDSEFSDIHFGRGSEITTWNGIPIDNAVKAATDFEEGSNTPHDFLLTLQFMTVRWLGASFGPDSPWVEVGYIGTDGQPAHHRFHWLTLQFDKDPKIVVAAQAVAHLFEDRFRSVQERERAVHIGSELVHLSRMFIFVKPIAEQRRTDDLERIGRSFRAKFYGYIGRAEMTEFTASEPLLKRDATDQHQTLLPMFIVAREHTVGEVIDQAGVAPPGDLKSHADLRFGYLGIRAFPLSGFPREIFSYELRRLLNLMPSGGLVLDIRDNPGGSANLAEEALQLFTARPITPLPFRFLASLSTRDISSVMYDAYHPSIATALMTGGRFSAGLPLTSVEHANEIGQQYFGPVVLITNGATYSAADVFAAGFRDHHIGEVIGLDETTGGGGANCWLYDDVRRALRDSIKPLPRGIDMQVAVRQCSRIGNGNDGVPIEEIGVQPTSRYALSIEDILGARPWRLLLRAASELAKKSAQRYDLVTTLIGGPRERRVQVKTENIDRLDFFVNGRPSSVDVKGTGRSDGALPTSPLLPADDRVTLEIRGYVRPNTLVARYVQVFPFLG